MQSAEKLEDVSTAEYEAQMFASTNEQVISCRARMAEKLSTPRFYVKFSTFLLTGWLLVDIL